MSKLVDNREPGSLCASAVRIHYPRQVWVYIPVVVSINGAVLPGDSDCYELVHLDRREVDLDHQCWFFLLQIAECIGWQESDHLRCDTAEVVSLRHGSGSIRR